MNRATPVEIHELRPEDGELCHRVAELLVAAFREQSPAAWPSLESALQEVQESFGADRISRVALGADRSALGWVGGLEQYRGHAWELHPLVVDPAHQLEGIGTALVRDFEAQVSTRGATMIWLGSDDEAHLTSLGGVDLFPDVLQKLSKIRNLSRHPYQFYQKLGYVIVGVLPDANGPGKPDILMAKRVGVFQSPSRDAEHKA